MRNHFIFGWREACRRFIQDRGHCYFGYHHIRKRYPFNPNIPPKVLLKTLHGFGPILGINNQRYQRICVFLFLFLSSLERRTIFNVMSVCTTTLLVFVLCLRKKLESFSLFSSLKGTCNPRLAMLVVGLIPPDLLMTLNILSIYPSVRIFSSSML